MCVAVLHILPLLAHTSRFLDVEIHPAAYLTMQVATSWLVPPILILATWRHQRRLARGDSEPSWYIPSRRSIPRPAKDRKSGVEGKSVAVRLSHVGRRRIKKKK